MKSNVDSDFDSLNDVFCARWEELHLDAYILTGSSDLADECVVVSLASSIHNDDRQGIDHQYLNREVLAAVNS